MFHGSSTAEDCPMKRVGNALTQAFKSITCSSNARLGSGLGICRKLVDLLLEGLECLVLLRHEMNQFKAVSIGQEIRSYTLRAEHVFQECRDGFPRTLKH